MCSESCCQQRGTSPSGSLPLSTCQDSSSGTSTTFFSTFTWLQPCTALQSHWQMQKSKKHLQFQSQTCHWDLPSRPSPSNLITEPPDKRHQFTLAQGQAQPQKTFTITPQTISPSPCLEQLSNFSPSSNPQENTSLLIRARSPQVLWN